MGNLPLHIDYYHIDAFVGAGKSGNPAGVCMLSEPLSEAQMQQIAAELNLPETAFVWYQENQYFIRWFTPNREVDLCGHATLAAAFVIFTYVNPILTDVSFQAISGLLNVRKDVEDAPRLILDFPSRVPVQIEIPAEIERLLGVSIIEAWKAKALMLVLKDEQQVISLAPDIPALIDLADCPVIVTAPGAKSDFVSRFFSLDRSEDPVTGSAHCTLTPYWSDKLGKQVLHAYQLSARGGELFCREVGERTHIGGYATCFLSGALLPGVDE